MTESVCAATKRNGNACTVRALPGSGFCWAHDPAKATQRHAARVAGGKGNATAAKLSRYLPAHLLEAQQKLIELMERVEQGTVPARAAEVVGGLVGRLLDIAKFAHEIGESAALDARIVALEERVAAEGKGRAG